MAEIGSNLPHTGRDTSGANLLDHDRPQNVDQSGHTSCALPPGSAADILAKVEEEFEYTLSAEPGWGFFPLDGGYMIKVNQFDFYALGASLSELRSIKPGFTFFDYATPIFQGQKRLSRFIYESSHVHLPLSKKAAEDLYKALRTAINVPEGAKRDFDKKIDAQTVKQIGDRLNAFETVLSMEAQNLDVYAVSQKAGYDTDTLIQRGEEIIPKSVRDYMPQYARDEMHEAGRCLAFELPTAAGFHMMRATESVLHSFWDVISGGKPRPTLNKGQGAPMGVYIAQVETEGADKKVTNMLRQIKDHHRNPLMHPDAVLTMTDATVLLGLTSSAVMVMVEEMKKKGATPQNPL